MRDHGVPGAAHGNQAAPPGPRGILMCWYLCALLWVSPPWEATVL